MSVHPQATEAKSNFVRKEREVREEKQSIFISLRSSRSSRTDAFASVFAWRRNKSNNSPQMNANEREFAFARHYRPRPAVCPRAIGYADVRFGILPSQSGAGRNPACLYES